MRKELVKAGIVLFAELLLALPYAVEITPMSLETAKMANDGLYLELPESNTQNILKYKTITPKDCPVASTTFLRKPTGIGRSDYLSELWGSLSNSTWADDHAFISEQRNVGEVFGTASWAIVNEGLAGSSLV